MSEPKAIVSVAVTLSDGTTKLWRAEDMDPGAHYTTSRNFTRPRLRKLAKGEAREEPETWIAHTIRFNTDRQNAKTWESGQTPS